MYIRSAVVIILILASLGARTGSAQIPLPIDIPIMNIPQETQVWCWAAVAQQIIHATRGPAQTPQQCALVAIANGAHPAFCCGGNPQCVRTGSLQQIQFLIAQFGGRYSAIAPPANPMALYQTLSGGRPIILHIRSGLSASHVVVLRGMSFMQTPFGIEPVLHVNDPMSYYTQPVPFSRLVGVWIDAIVVG